MKQLGLFGGAFDWNDCRPLVREALKGIAGYLDESEVEAIADYLDQGAIVDAWMEYAEDLLEGSFGVAGGSATKTDGEYVWRCDTSAYVREYRLALPLEFLEHGRARSWQIPTDLDDDVARFRVARNSGDNESEES